MKITSRILLPTLLLGAPLALAEQAPAPTPVPAAAAAPAVKTIDVSFRGSLRDALKRIAEDGGLNVVATGELDTSVEVHLKGVTGAQALRTIARTYSLRLDEDGSIFTLRPMTAMERESATARAAPPAPPAAPLPPAPPSPPAMAQAPVAAENLSDEARAELEEAKAEAAEAAEEARQEAAEAAEEARREAADAAEQARQEAAEATEVDANEIQERVRNEVRKHRNKGDGDVVSRGQPLEVKEADTVGNAVVYGSTLSVKGRVEEDAVVFGGNLEISGVVEGDANAFGGNIVLHPSAIVNGDVSAIGGNVVREPGSHVKGSIESFGGGKVGSLVAGEVKNLKKELRSKGGHDESQDEEERHGSSLPGFIIKFAALFGLGFLGQLFFPNRMKDLSSELRTQPLKSGLVGMVGALALIPISVVLAITIIGAPVAVALWLAAMLVTMLGFTAVASEIGVRLPILRGKKTQAVVLALGLLILLALTSVPVLGWLVMLASCFMGFGAALLTRFGHKLRGFPEPLSRTPTGV